ncbi:hypothetical protein CPB85DRAFT_1437192 [Mucidula mucida]|nr:hypothetical protein CPB85DRAFT_1437192 [Mucidula mucida]
MCNTIKTTNTTYQPLSYEAFYEYLNHYVVASLLDLHRPDVVYMHSPAEVNFTLQALDESTMLTALSRGSSSALRIFGDMQWIRFLGMGWVVANIPFPKSIYRPISCYLTGLCKVNDPERQYQSYLCENPNLVIAFLCLSEDATEVNRLFEVCTRHSDWQQCRDTLKALLKWMQLDRSERRLVVCPIIVPRSLGCTHRFPPNMGPHLSKALDEEWADV